MLAGFLRAMKSNKKPISKTPMSAIIDVVRIKILTSNELIPSWII